jgi:hypothetical protein
MIVTPAKMEGALPFLYLSQQGNEVYRQAVANASSGVHSRTILNCLYGRALDTFKIPVMI